NIWFITMCIILNSSGPTAPAQLPACYFLSVRAHCMKVNRARRIILVSIVLTGTLFSDPALSQNHDSSGDTPKIQGAEETCINPAPLFDVNEFPGPIKKTAAYISRKLERTTVPEPPRRPGT